MGWIPSSATNVILNWPERIKTQPHEDRDNCFLPFDSKGNCGMTVNNDIDDDSASKDSDSHTWDPAAVEPLTCSSVGQDLAEPETFDEEAAYVSSLHIRAVMALKFCSISVSPVAKSQVIFSRYVNPYGTSMP